jgi:hypothetical protein
VGDVSPCRVPNDGAQLGALDRSVLHELASDSIDLMPPRLKDRARRRPERFDDTKRIAAVPK